MRIIFNASKGQHVVEAAKKGNQVAYDRGLPAKLFQPFRGGIAVELNSTTRHLEDEIQTVAKMAGFKPVKVLS